VRNGKLCVAPNLDDGDLHVRPTPARFLALALRRGDEATPGVGKVEISGDAELARRMERLAREFRPDFEEAFARVFGDIAGVALARAFAGAFAYACASGQALVQDSAEYLREESRDLIAPAEMEQFLDDVDGLRERADRLQARLRRVTVRKDAG
jgi:ubiquinone biosynthesis protein UbiJ